MPYRRMGKINDTRRNLLIGSALAAASQLAFSGISNAQSNDRQAAADAGNSASTLPELAYGDANAPVTVIEYTSLTCSYCASFHVEALPEFKRTHIETGRARLVLREFPFDPRSLAGFMLARCLGGQRTYAMIDILFQNQSDWARVENGAAALRSYASLAGMSSDEFETCLSDANLQASIEAVRDEGASKFGISATPTFIVDDEVHVGALSAAELAAMVDALT